MAVRGGASNDCLLRPGYGFKIAHIDACNSKQAIPDFSVQKSSIRKKNARSKSRMRLLIMILGVHETDEQDCQKYDDNDR